MRITLLLILIFTVTLSAVPARAQEEEIVPVQAPETIEEAQEFGLNILREIPDAAIVVWETQVLPLWNKMWDITKNIWDTTVSPWIKELWNQVLSFFGQEIEKRRPLIEEEFRREKEQLQQEIEENIPESGKTLWSIIKRFLPGNETK